MNTISLSGITNKPVVRKWSNRHVNGPILSKCAYALLLAAVTVLSASCAKAPENGNEAVKEGASITVWAPFGEIDGRHEDYLNLVKAFEDETGVRVINEMPKSSSEEWKISVVDSFNEGKEPDVLFFFIGETGKPILDKVVDLDAIRKEYADYAVNINVGVLNSMREEDGKNYCVPATGFWEAMFVNNDLFEQLNVKIPENFQELELAAIEFRKAGITPIAANLKDTPHYWFEYLIYDYTGPDFHSYQVTERANYDRWIKGLDMFKTLYDIGAFPDEDVSDDRCIEMFKNKEAAIMLDGSWSPLVSSNDSVRVVHTPVLCDEGNRQKTDIIGGFSMGYYITSKGFADNKEAAVSFVKFMTNENALTVFNKSGSASPGKTAQQTNETETLVSINEMVGASTAFSPAIQDTFSKEAREYLFSQIMAIAEGKADSKEVLDKFVEINDL